MVKVGQHAHALCLQEQSVSKAFVRFFVDLLVHRCMLLSISQSLGEISLNLIKVMNRKKDINLVFLKSFDLLLDLYLLS